MTIPIEDMNEAEARMHLIDPALDRSGWSMNRLRLEFTLTAGRIVNEQGAWTRGEGSSADYVLMPSPDFFIGVVEAKDPSYAIEAGIQQALDYAVLLDLPFAASTNGRGFLFHDKTGLLFDNGAREVILSMDNFPTIDRLSEAYARWKNPNLPEEVPESVDNLSPLYQKSKEKFIESKMRFISMLKSLQ